MAKVKNAVAVKPGTELAVVKADANLPAYLTGYKGPKGTENIDRGDIALPRVKVGQGLSSEVKDGVFGIGDIFLNIGGTLIAKKGTKVPFVIVAQGKEFILWRPREDNGGGILARAQAVDTPNGKRYEWNKPNTKFDVKIKGVAPATWQTKKYIEDDKLDQWGSEFGFNKDGTPINKDSNIAATAHHNYVVVFPTLGNLMAALSLSRSATKPAKDLNYMLDMGNAPIFAKLFNMETVDQSNAKGDFSNVKFSGAGFVDEKDFSSFKRYFDGFQGRHINVDQSDVDAQGEAADARA